MVATRPVTVEALWEIRDEPYRFTLLDGELIRMPGAGGIHGRTVVRLSGRLDSHVTDRNLGAVFSETGFILFPDIAFVRADRLPPLDEQERFLRLVPDLAVEIISPTDYPKLIAIKLAAYADAGTTEVWVMYPRKRPVEVHRRGAEVVILGPDAMLESPELLPRFSVRVGDLFPSSSFA